MCFVTYDVSMEKLGFDLHAHRDALDKVVKQQTADEANRIARESNIIAEKSLKSNRLISIIALILSGTSIVVAVIALSVK